jgi:hypothetical protein
MSGLEGSGTTAAAMWRSTTAAMNTAAGNKAAGNKAAVNEAVHQTPIKHYVVTTPDAGRDNKGTSPWRFPV